MYIYIEQCIFKNIRIEREIIVFYIIDIYLNYMVTKYNYFNILGTTETHHIHHTYTCVGDIEMYGIL